MKQLFRVALQHHYGWQVYEALAENLAQAAYLAVRESHEFLTDDNHTHTEGPESLEWGGETIHFNSVTIMKNDASPSFLLAPKWVTDGPGAYWLGVTYRAALPDEVNPAWMERRDPRRTLVAA